MSAQSTPFTAEEIFKARQVAYNQGWTDCTSCGELASVEPEGQEVPDCSFELARGESFVRPGYTFHTCLACGAQL